MHQVTEKEKKHPHTIRKNTDTLMMEMGWFPAEVNEIACTTTVEAAHLLALPFLAEPLPRDALLLQPLDAVSPGAPSGLASSDGATRLAAVATDGAIISACSRSPEIMM